jgi:hyperosmotically inducible periplasmic protein
MKTAVVHQTAAVLGICSLAVVLGCAPEDRSTPSAGAPAASPTLTAQTDDGQLATNVQSRYQNDPTISSQDIAVTAENGVVSLRGTVGSDQARDHAVATARQVEGVRSVNDELRVVAGVTAGTSEGGPRPVGTTGRDEGTPLDITTRIQAQYFRNTDVRPSNIEVTTAEGGVVTLRGEAETARVREEAERVARETEGVSRVVNEIRLPGEAEPTERPAAENPEEVARADEWVTARVQAKYFLSNDIKSRNLSVSTRNGVVTLTGEVETEAERQQAVTLARNTDGVQSVNDELRLQPSAPAGDVTGDPDRTPPPADSRPGGVMAAVDDTWITTKIQSRYFLDQSVKGRNINVDTRGGVVTLSGTVESDTERRLAETIAAETEGVSRVENQLRVGPSPD